MIQVMATHDIWDKRRWCKLQCGAKSITSSMTSCMALRGALANFMLGARAPQIPRRTKTAAEHMGVHVQKHMSFVSVH